MVYIERLLPILSERLDSSSHIQYYISWCTKLLSLHTETIKQNSTSLASLITDLQKSIIQKQRDLGKLYVTIVCMKYELTLGRQKVCV